MKRLLALLSMLLLATLSRVAAQGVDDQYVRIYTAIYDADNLNSNGQSRLALTKYLEAQTALQRFQKINPSWNASVVKYRLEYLANKISDLAAKVPMPAPTTPPAAGQNRPPSAGQANPGNAATRNATPSEADSQLAALREQVRQLQAEKLVLQSKLKESLAAQPAPLDTRQLAAAQERVRTLQKENDLLKVSLEHAKARPGSPAELKANEQLKASLAEANRQLAVQNDRATTLALERTALQQKVRSLLVASAPLPALDSTKRELEQASKELADQRALTARLTGERDALQAKLKAPDAAADAAALRNENQLLKKQLAELSTNSPAATKAQESARQLAQAQAQIAVLKSDKDILSLEKLALETRVHQMATNAPAAAALATPAVVTSSVLPPASKSAEAARIKQLEEERDELQKKLGAANKELYGRGARAAASRVQELENQVTVLRARLEAFEARRAPYSQEELALFKMPQPVLAPDPHAGKKSIRELPPGSATLVAEAQRFFSARQFDRAEENYLKILHQDEKSVPTLANLAAIQLELKHYEDAEKNIQKALSLAPEDAYSLLVLGQIRLTQGKYDDAVDALSHAAKIEPQNAQIQNFLGMALNEKGLRGPAETALRRAIQIDPGYGNAHYSLAVVYATQQPPLVELARWHYQKALAAGIPRNADLERLLDNRPAIPDVR